LYPSWCFWGSVVVGVSSAGARNVFHVGKNNERYRYIKRLPPEGTEFYHPQKKTKISLFFFPNRKRVAFKKEWRSASYHPWN
jgi:hypothetical protein